MAENLTPEAWEEHDKACRVPDGYAEHNFLEAFDLLCREAGGYRSGLEQAIKLMKEQVQ